MSTLEPGRLIAGKYRLERRLARGGMGAVWIAVDQKLRRRVAVKFIDAAAARFDRARERFDAEARASAQIQSPHVVQTHDYGVDGDHAYLVMELLDGEDLGVHLTRNPRLPPATVARLLFQIARGLDAVHAAGIIHRDLKPGNIFLARVADEETIKLIDFGVARMENGSRASIAGALVGTVKYMAPEQILCEPTIDHRADLWALAVIAYRMLTGKVPFSASSLEETATAICKAEPEPPSTLVPELPAGVDAFFQRALARDPDRRFHSARQMASSFSAVLNEARTGTLGWGTRAPAAAVALIAQRRGEVTEAIPGLGASSPAILPSSYTPSPRSAPSDPRSRLRRWWWASLPAALAVAGAVVFALVTLAAGH